ncbi:MAG: hypothetical protein CSB33_01365 [Desulfobacterales bacterium]|nr:MAG: hypothetical protein CSB33_01365 [Desulfobacterales bacterium]
MRMFRSSLFPFSPVFRGPLSTTLCIALLVFFAGAGCQQYSKSEYQDIHIALIGPMTGGNADVGKAFEQGVHLYVDAVNRNGGINGRRIIIDKYDDANNPELAREAAYNMASDNKAVAVIGHHYSSCSIAGGEIYKDIGVPAITPASTNVNVTLDNPWYFRASFNDRLQGRFLANYARNVFQETTASIIYEDDSYGSYLAKVFESSFTELGNEVRHKWAFNAKARSLENELKRIVYDLKSRPDAGVIFVATHSGPGVKILTLMKDAKVLNPVMGPDAFASESFRRGFESLLKEKRNPGFYTNGMYVTTPIIFDTTNDKGQRFRDAYRKQYGRTPGWHAAFAYDSVLVLVNAIRETDVKCTADTMAEDRRRLRNFLAKMNSMDHAVEGVTGFNYFDENGDAGKPVLIGVYKNRNIISALTQFQTISNPAELAHLERARKEGRVMMFDGRFMYRINVVYTGVEMRKISDLDLKKMTCFLDFYLWFRYQGGASLNDFVFFNAVERTGDEKKSVPPLTTELLEQRQTEDGLQYFLYRVRGRFHMDHVPERFGYGEHMIGVSFRHPVMDRNNLIYVKDVLGMGESHDEQALLDHLRENQTLSPASGWLPRDVWFYQDTAAENSMGNPDYLNISGGSVDYSRFNMGIRIVPDKFILRNLIPPGWVDYMLGSSLLLLILLPFAGKPRFLRPFLRLTWILQLLLTFMLLLSAEYFLINRLAGTYFIAPVILACNILWWLIPAYLLNLSIRRFIWNPLEEQTGRRIPHIIRNAVAIFIYTIAFFGIIAFVFDQRLTSLLATSGVIAMILGLAIQINISNIFSGIAINMERPFRVGDWIRISDGKEGKVIDINWRATRIRTRDDTIICVPNSQASESAIENFSYPDEGYFMYFTLHVDPSHTPEKVKKILLDAVLSTAGVDEDPAPGVRFLGLVAGITRQSESWAANYLVSVHVQDYGQKFAVNEAVWQNLWIHMRRAGIRHVIQRRETRMVFEGIRRKKEIQDASMSILNELDIFTAFSHEEKQYLSRRMARHHFFPGEQVVRQGDSGNSLFIIAEGVVSVRIKFDARTAEMEVARMGAGNFFGEMALLTGELRTASVYSLTETRLYEITKADIAPLIENAPRISRQLSDLLTKRKMATESHKYEGDDQDFDKNTIATQIFNKIQYFFGFGQ